MKQINIRLNIKYIFFIISYLKLYTKCAFDCTTDCKRVGNDCVYKNNFIQGSECSACRPNLLNKNSEECYSCTGSGNYYSFSNDISGACTKSGSCSGKKSVEGSNQCASSCGSYLYEMGTHCYPDCVGGNRKEVSSSIKKCTCRYLYYEEGGDKICLDEGVYCKTGLDFYNYETGECSNGCGSPKLFVFTTQRDGSTVSITRCSNSCLEGEYVNGNYCVKKCDKYYYEVEGTKEKKCTNSCPAGYILESSNGKECKKKDNCKYLNNGISGLSNCLNNCNYYITYKSNDGYKYCSTTCISPTPYIPENSDKICLNSCPSNFYKYTDSQKTQKKCVSVTDAQYCYYTGSGSGLKECLLNCLNIGNKFNNVGSHECISGCTGNFLYHKKDDFICYESCDLIPDIGKNYIILSGNICDCGLYADDTGTKVCYNNEEECLNKGYKYKLGNKCIKANNCPFKVESGTNTGSENYLKKCFSNVEQCSNNNFPYYNRGSKTCWASCPDNMYSNPLNNLGKPREDTSRNTCTSQCTDPFSYKSDITKTCKEECDPGEYIKEDTKECLSSCPDTYFIGENNECFSNCNFSKFIIEYPSITKKKKKSVFIFIDSVIIKFSTIKTAGYTFFFF